jgi:hypothetical protein
MAGIEAGVFESFLERLAATGDVPEQVTEKLSTALVQEKLPKADEIAEIYREGSGDPVA